MATKDSRNQNLIPGIHTNNLEGLVSVAAGKAGAGRLIYLGDVNAEAASVSIVHGVADAMFR